MLVPRRRASRAAGPASLATADAPAAHRPKALGRLRRPTLRASRRSTATLGKILLILNRNLKLFSV